MRLAGHLVWALLDSGCEISLVPGELVRRVGLSMVPTTRTLGAANSTDVEVKGEVTLPLYLNGRRIETFALVSEDVEELMLGAEWLQQHGCVWDFGKNRFHIDGHQCTPVSRAGTVRCRRVLLANDVVLPPRQEVNVTARSTVTSLKRLGQQGLVESQLVRPGVYTGRTLLPPRIHHLAVGMVNTSPKLQALSVGTLLENVAEVKAVSVGGMEGGKTSTAMAERNIVEDAMKNLPPELTAEQCGSVRQLIEEHRDLFSTNEYDVGRTHLVEHCIDAGAHRPIRQQLRRHPLAHL